MKENTFIWKTVFLVVYVSNIDLFKQPGKKDTPSSLICQKKEE